MSTQINIRIDDLTAQALDGLAAELGRTRAEIVREAVLQRLAIAAANRIDDAYRDAYREHPESRDELRRAGQVAARLTREEPWEPWW